MQLAPWRNRVEDSTEVYIMVTCCMFHLPCSDATRDQIYVNQFFDEFCQFGVIGWSAGVLPMPTGDFRWEQKLPGKRLRALLDTGRHSCLEHLDGRECMSPVE